MKLLYGLTASQMREVYFEVAHYDALDNVIFVAKKSFPNEKFSEEEIKIAASYAVCFDDDETDWVKYAQDALQMVIDERPHEEPPKSRLDQVLFEYGLRVGQVFTILKNNQHGLYYFDSVGDLYFSNPKNNGAFELSEKTLGTFIVDFSHYDILPIQHNFYDSPGPYSEPNELID